MQRGLRGHAWCTAGERRVPNRSAARGLRPWQPPWPQSGWATPRREGRRASRQPAPPYFKVPPRSQGSGQPLRYRMRRRRRHARRHHLCPSPPPPLFWLFGHPARSLLPFPLSATPSPPPSAIIILSLVAPPPLTLAPSIRSPRRRVPFMYPRRMVVAVVPSTRSPRLDPRLSRVASP